VPRDRVFLLLPFILLPGSAPRRLRRVCNSRHHSATLSVTRFSSPGARSSNCSLSVFILARRLQESLLPHKYFYQGCVEWRTPYPFFGFLVFTQRATYMPGGLVLRAAGPCQHAQPRLYFWSPVSSMAPSPSRQRARSSSLTRILRLGSKSR